MFFSDTSSRDYPELYLESDYGQRTVIKKLNNFSYIVGFLIFLFLRIEMLTLPPIKKMDIQLFLKGINKLLYFFNFDTYLHDCH